MTIIIISAAAYLIYKVYRAFKNAPVQFEWEEHPKIHRIIKYKEAIYN